MLSVTVELPLEAGELIEKALDKARDQEKVRTTAWLTFTSINPPRGGLLSAVEKLVNGPPPPRHVH